MIYRAKKITFYWKKGELFIIRSISNKMFDVYSLKKEHICNALNLSDRGDLDFHFEKINLTRLGKL